VYHPFIRPYQYGSGNWLGTLNDGNFSGPISNSSHTPMRSVGALGGPVQVNSCNFQAPVNEAGITVPGSESQQKFQDVWGFATEDNSEVLVLKLVGRNGETAVERPVTVDLRPSCQTCQRKSRAGALYCSHCGTSLVLI